MSGSARGRTRTGAWLRYCGTVGNQTATEKTNINLKRSEETGLPPPAGQVGTDVHVERICFFPFFPFSHRW
jgi:hypothetical protein